MKSSVGSPILLNTLNLFIPVFTRDIFFQKKFSIDKKYGHLSDLISSAQLDREQALKDICIDDYPLQAREEDIDFVCKKLEFSREDLNNIINRPAKGFSDFRNSYKIIKLMKETVNKLRSKGLYPK